MSPTESSAPRSRQVPCPACGGPSLFAPENRWRPFCSERCSQVDLGAWASEAYRMPDPPAVEDPDNGARH